MYCDEHSVGGPVTAEEEIRDLIEGVDEDGNTVLLEVVRYFFYNGEEYVEVAFTKKQIRIPIHLKTKPRQARLINQRFHPISL